MSSRVAWLLGTGAVAIACAAGISIASWAWHPTVPRAGLPPVRYMPEKRPQPYSEAELAQFLADAQNAEKMPDLLQRCLSYPDPPGVRWDKAATQAYCRYSLDPAIKPEEVARLIQSGQADQLDRRLANALQQQLSEPGAEALFDRTYLIIFGDATEALRALVDAWKRQRPASPYALAASGTVYLSMAQQARGAAMAAQTEQTQFDAMHRLLLQARADLDQAVALQPKLTAAYAAMIYVAMLDRDLAYAIKAARQALAVDPANYTVYSRMVLLAQPKWGGSVTRMARIIAKAQQHDKENPLLELLRSERSGGEDYVSDCQCDRAQEFHQIYTGLFAQPAPSRMFSNAGWGAAHRHAPDAASIYRSEFLRFTPNSDEAGEVRESRVFNLAAIGATDWAVSEGNAVVALRPQSLRAYEGRGKAYRKAKNIEQAIADYEQALRIAPRDDWTMAELADIHMHDTHDWNKAWDVGSRFIEYYPHDPRGWLIRAFVQLYQPRAGFEQTMADYRNQFESNPKALWITVQMESLQIRYAARKSIALHRVAGGVQE